VQQLSLYIEKETFIHQKVDPITKLTYFIAVTIMAFLMPVLGGAIILFLLQLLLLLWARELRRAGKLMFGILIVLISLFIIQGMFHPDNQVLLWQLGPLRFYQEGLMVATTITLRMLNMISAGALLILTTSPNHLMEACERRGMSPKLGYIITSIFQMIPIMLRNAAVIQQAQESRGMNVKGNLWRRFQAFIPLIVPLILSSLYSIRERAIALEVRAFSAKGKKSFLHEEKILPAMYLIRLLIICSLAGVTIWRVCT
jgi:energy-coupling factor transport system permease protein